MDAQKKELATRVSLLYYEENLSQNEVASKLGISRSYVSQLLAYARLNNIVKIVVNVDSLYPHAIRKEIEFSKHFPNVKQFSLGPFILHGSPIISLWCRQKQCPTAMSSNFSMSSSTV